MRPISFLALFFVSCFSFAGCISFNDAPKHVGENRCIKGKIIRIDPAEAGFTRLSFCREPAECAFTALIFGAEAEKAGGVEELQGKTIIVKGRLNEFNGNAQRVVSEPGQLSFDAIDMPSLMKAYDVDERGHYSPGTSRAPKARRVYTKKETATLPAEIPEDAEDGSPPAR